MKSPFETFLFCLKLLFTSRSWIFMKQETCNLKITVPALKQQRRKSVMKNMTLEPFFGSVDFFVCRRMQPVGRWNLRGPGSHRWCFFLLYSRQCFCIYSTSNHLPFVTYLIILIVFIPWNYMHDHSYLFRSSPVMRKEYKD